MDCVVDAGRILKIRAKDTRDAALLAIVELGPETKFPIAVDVPATGVRSIFILAERQEVSTKPLRPFLVTPSARCEPAKARRKKNGA